LYLIGPTGSGTDKYEEYVYTSDGFVKIGETTIDLSGYVTTTALSNALESYVLTSSITDVLRYSAQTITDAQKSQARTNIGAYAIPNTGIPESDLADAVSAKLNATEVFMATYNATTYSEIEEAFNAGKVVICHDRNGYDLRLEKLTSEYAYFMTILAIPEVESVYAICDTNDIWTSSTASIATQSEAGKGYSISAPLTPDSVSSLGIDGNSNVFVTQSNQAATVYYIPVEKGQHVLYTATNTSLQTLRYGFCAEVPAATKPVTNVVRGSVD
jgi:hypothetical protein